VDRSAGEFEAPKALHSPYATELQRGPIALRFPAGLEREFRRSHLDRIRTRARGWQVALLFLGLASVLMTALLGMTFGFNRDTLLCCGVLLPTCVVTAVVAWSRNFDRWYVSAAQLGSAIIGVFSSVLVAQAVVAGRVEALTFVTTNMMATFFLVGLMFFDAFRVGLLSLIAFSVAGAIFGMPLEKLVYDSALLALLTLVIACIAHGVEETNRRFFLQRGALGDLAERDGLTGLRNRRAFDEHLVRVWQQSLRDRSALAILMIDLDYFKAYNDQYGHQAGDHCLRHVAQVVQRFARRPLDIAARYGGEELAIVLYQVTTEQAQTIAEQLRATIAGARIEHRGSQMHGIVTVSIGIAWTQATLDHSPQDTVQVADEALYAAKLEGRNRTIYQGADQAHTFTAKLRRAPRLRPVR
jgi:diguanylate cyclase (GGDEF)-like protein